MKFKIDISEPCHENWQQMTPTEKGRFCANCQKEVFDFTQLSAFQITQKVKQSKSLCGRFKKHQLEREYATSSSPYLSRLGIALGLGSIIAIAQPTKAQTQKASTEIMVQQSQNNSEKEQNTTSKDTVVNITGTVVGADDNMPIPAVNVIIKGTTKGTTTDFDGNFELHTPKGTIQNKETIFVFSAIGIDTNEILINKKTKFPLEVMLESDESTISTGMVVTAFHKPNIFQRFLNLFRKKENKRY